MTIVAILPCHSQSRNCLLMTNPAWMWRVRTGKALTNQQAAVTLVINPSLPVGRVSHRYGNQSLKLLHVLLPAVRPGSRLFLGAWGRYFPGAFRLGSDGVG